jgi:dTDP-4-dehydrorhamnose 3,5-epimerase
MFEMRESVVAGCYEIRPKVFGDARGLFVKVFQAEAFAELGLETEFREDFYTTSQRGVIRGMHFQAPPRSQAKIVYPVVGRVLDVVVDLRIGSPTYGQHAQLELDADRPSCLYIPPGLAHGFCVLGASATLIYKVSKSYAPECDDGIAWNSAGIRWPVAVPIVSARDRHLTRLTDYSSPFVYEC